MPTAVGPFSLQHALPLRRHLVERAVPRDRVELAVLSYLPFFMRSSGVVRRSAPYMILDR
jgi:hypothetical protein